MSAASTFKQPQPGPQYEALGVFVGNWHAEGESYARGQKQSDPRGSVERWVSDETFEWISGQFFVLQRWNAKTGADPFLGVGIIGCNPDGAGYVTHSFENHGFYRRYETRREGNVWTFNGDTERARVEFSDGGRTQIIRWEWRPEGKEWLPLCDRVAKRVD